ncbi:testis-expressed basic protein 1-like [Dasypus novemcinctus]|uniref:testis-expressed basic protein 1-like n=1 Tax=Dasypus novemcinctus TaxID=9361 RepID=UPI00265F433E|nr:testis-expressed basic protein 1-like [Dasypus novemcinctus]
MAILEITLAVILVLLGIAILTILLVRWSRRKQNELDISRYNSEQSAGLLEYEDFRDYSSQAPGRGRGFRRSYSTESDTSFDDRERSRGYYTPSVSSIALSQTSIGRNEEKSQSSIRDPGLTELLPSKLEYPS